MPRAKVYRVGDRVFWSAQGHPLTHPTDNVQGRSPYAGRDSMGALSRIFRRESPLMNPVASRCRRTYVIKCGGAKLVRQEHDSAGCWPAVVPDVDDKDCVRTTLRCVHIEPQPRPLVFCQTARLWLMRRSRLIVFSVLTLIGRMESQAEHLTLLAWPSTRSDMLSDS